MDVKGVGGEVNVTAKRIIEGRVARIYMVGKGQMKMLKYFVFFEKTLS